MTKSEAPEGPMTNPTRRQLVAALVKWRMDTQGLSGGQDEAWWSAHYAAEKTSQLLFLINFYRISMESENRLANAVQEDPVEGEERPLHHEYGVQLYKGMVMREDGYFQAVKRFGTVNRTTYPNAFLVERVVSDWRSLRQIDRHVSEHGLGPAADAPAPYQISGERFRELADQEYADVTGMPLSTDEDPGCTVCGRDNRNGTHDALEQAGHLDHSFAPAVTPLEKAEAAQQKAEFDALNRPGAWSCERCSWTGDGTQVAYEHFKTAHPGESMYLGPDHVIREKS